jgi:hypothetical protein
MRERLPKLTSAAAVIAAISECKQLGREAFLSRHGFRRSREYTLYYGGAPFDSKAIYGVALGIEHPDRGPFSSVDFRGGDALVAPSLRALGFVVERTTQYPSGNVGGWIVLVENEVTEGGRYDDWKDATGERYHFPNQYRGLVRSGAQFVYYRGVRRRESKRGTPEYFGAGVVGDVWRDQDVPLEAPKSHWKWFAEICDYAPFLNPVPAKSDGRSVERIAQNRWGVGVRRIERSQFEQLCALGGRATSPSAIAAVLLKEAPRLEEISPQLLAKGESLLIPRRLPEGSAGDSGGSAPRSNHS